MTGSPRVERLGLIIGSMKAGTSSLFAYLAAHPGIAPCPAKEPNYFSDPGRVRAGPERYWEGWAVDPARHRVALEASTTYTMRPAIDGVAARIDAFPHPDVRFLYLVRDPVDRIESHLSHLATRRGGADRVGETDLRQAIQVSRYAMQLEPYADRWPRDSILLLRYEELVAEPARVAARALRFLGLEPVPAVDAATGTTHNARADMAADQVLAGVLGRAPWLGPLRRFVPDPVWSRVRAAVGARSAHTVHLTPEERERARGELAEDMARLREEWDVDVAEWSALR